MGIFGFTAKPSTYPAYKSNPNYPDVTSGQRTGRSSNDATAAGRPVMRNVPTAVVGVHHQKYDSPPIPGGDFLQFDYQPYQAQPINLQQRQYGYPKPGIDLTPPDATYHLTGGIGTEGTSNSRISSPFAANNVPKNTPPRPTELIEDFGRPNYRPPISRWLSQKTPVGYSPEMQYAHKLTVGLTPYAPARDFPRSYNGWTHREYFTDRGAVPGQDAPYAPAERERPTIKAGAPPQLQVSPGGLVINAYANVQKNINLDLNALYKGAKAPVSSSYSGKCT